MVYADNYPRETERFAVLADVVVLIHLVVVLFITAGLPLIYLGAALGWTWVRDWRWRILHLVAIAFVAAQSLFGIACPLTIWEDALRGRKPNVGFIEGWIDGILFYDLRAWVFTAAYIGFAALVIVTWFAIPPRWPSAISKGSK
jgi:hypothetical protein